MEGCGGDQGDVGENVERVLLTERKAQANPEHGVKDSRMHNEGVKDSMIFDCTERCRTRVVMMAATGVWK